MMHTVSSPQLIRRLSAEGWSLRNRRGTHYQFVHPSRSGCVTVKHPSWEIPIGTLRGIYRQAKWKREDR